jgi:hypothetical protein
VELLEAAPDYEGEAVGDYLAATLAWSMRYLVIALQGVPITLDPVQIQTKILEQARRYNLFVDRVLV